MAKRKLGRGPRLFCYIDRMSNSQHWLDGILDVLREAIEGGETGKGTAFVENTRSDGVRHGLLPTLERLSAAQASQILQGASIAGHAQHAAFHLEVLIRWEQDGERGPFDWKGSFLPSEVNETEWQKVQQRLEAAYKAVLAFAETQRNHTPDGDLTGTFVGATAHVAYHLGAVRQMVKELGA